MGSGTGVALIKTRTVTIPPPDYESNTTARFCRFFTQQQNLGSALYHEANRFLFFWSRSQKRTSITMDAFHGSIGLLTSVPVA